MTAAKAKSLSSLFRSAVKAKNSSSSSPAEEGNFKEFLSLVGSVTSSQAVTKRPIKPLFETSQFLHDKSSQRSAGDFTLSSFMLDETSSSDHISDNSPDMQGIASEQSEERGLDIPWFGDLLKKNISSRRKEVSRERKQKWIYKSSQDSRFNQLVKMCGAMLGTEITVDIFGRLGRETGIKEYNALMKICVEDAKKSSNEEVALQQIHKAFRLFKSMKERGFQLEEETYGPFLAYLIEMEMVKEFYFFHGVIKGENTCSLSRLGYYEMLLCIRVNNEQKIQELCNYVMNNDDEENKSSLLENYLLALCESDRKKELLQLLEIIDITKFSVDSVASIFKALGTLLLESFAERLFMVLKASDYEEENITNFIYSYAVGIPNSKVEDVISSFKNLHVKLEVTPSRASYEKLILYCCDSLKVHSALDLVDEMYEVGLTLSMEALHTILHALEESCNFNLVHRAYSLISRHNLKPNCETFRIMITLCVRMKNFDGAYRMLNDLEKMNLKPTVIMYNAIMGGYFREKNIYGGMRVLKQMEEADVKPDSKTYSYLISNCESEGDVDKYYEELKHSGIKDTKHVNMALINAYASFGQFEKAKQLVSGELRFPYKSLIEEKSVLAQALASHGQWSDALDIYKEFKQAGSTMEPKALISLIEHIPYDGELSTLLQLLEEFNDSDYWVDGCCRVILYCVRYKHLSPAINLLKQLKDKFCNNELALGRLFDEVFCLIGELDPTYLQIGLDLLHAVKHELGLTPSRKCLDFLLHACMEAKDLNNVMLIWKEYKEAGLPYNVLTFLRMYKALLAAGDLKAAKLFLTKIPKDDPDVRFLIKEMQTTYIEKPSTKKENFAKKKSICILKPPISVDDIDKKKKKKEED
ncbi:hypothetical protein FNV43_RR03965 [Rhamnella rubrinervis]|uniref:PROP1-like PPR domain-containing protein n=1 Tax=Rhamnella rubrinervis TaxID=2594499 RepID=A0A8K0HKU3_9ROSA|nr:hypothetical protein FNV43_RR03965 [Rhamnella rubrinervis]